MATKNQNRSWNIWTIMEPFVRHHGFRKVGCVGSAQLRRQVILDIEVQIIRNISNNMSVEIIFSKHTLLIILSKFLRRSDSLFAMTFLIFMLCCLSFSSLIVRVRALLSRTCLLAFTSALASARDCLLLISSSHFSLSSWDRERERGR